MGVTENRDDNELAEERRPSTTVKTEISGSVINSKVITAGRDVIIKIVNVIPEKWQDAISNFLSTYRYFFVLAVALQTGLLALYRNFKDLYLIPSWVWGLVAISLLIATWVWYTIAFSLRSITRLGVALFATTAFIVLFSLQAWSIAYPPEFDNQQFGIVIAELGEGADYSRTDKAREISGQAYELLCEAIERGFSTSQIEDPCTRPKVSPDPRIIAIERIGVIPDSSTAYEIGKRLNADIVIWGQILTTEEQAATIRFKMIGTFDQVSEPDFPYVLPVTQSPANIFRADFELNLKNGTIDLKQIVSQQTQAVASYIVGVIAFLEQEYETAVSKLNTAAETLESEEDLEATSESLGLLYYYLGISNHYLRQVHEGQDWLKKAREKLPQEPAIYLSLAYGYRRLGDMELFQTNLNAALSATNDILSFEPDNWYALYDRGIIYELRGEPAQAVFDYERIIRLNSDFYLAYINRGYALQADCAYKEAEEALLNALKVAEISGASTASAYVGLARARRALGAYDEARDNYESAIAAARPLDFLYREYAEFLESQQDFDGAREQYENLIENTNEKGAAQREMAKFLERINNKREAEIYYRRAIHEDPTNGVTRAYLANLYYFELERKQEAYELYEEALEEGEPHYYPFSSYGYILLLEEDYERAAEMIERSLEIRPDGIWELENLLVIYSHLKRVEDAQRVEVMLNELEVADVEDTIEQEASTCE